MSDAALPTTRAEALLDLGRASDAEPLIRSALEDDPGDADLLGLLARCLLEQGRPADAVDVAQQVIAAAPTESLGYFYLALGRGALESHEAARQAILGAIERAPLWSPYHEVHAAILLALGRPGDAADAAEHARALDPENADAATIHAAALGELGRLDEADAAIAEALRLDPESDAAQHTAGGLRLRRGGGKEAVARYREALRLDPTDESTREALAVALKTRNPLYGQLVRFWIWESQLPSGAQWAILLAPLLLIRVIRATGDSPVATALLVAVFALIALTWAIEPLMNLTLLAMPSGRVLLDRATRFSTLVFLGFAAAAATCALLGLVADDGFLVLAMGLGLCSLSVGSAHELEGDRRRLFQGATAVAAAAAVIGAVSVVAGWDPGIATAALVLFLGGIAGLWYVRLAS